MGFPRQEHWNMLPFPTPGDLDPEIEPISVCLLHWQAGSLPPGKTWEPTISSRTLETMKSVSSEFKLMGE